MRIRTVKPGFMKHEELQELEVGHPGKYIMLTFQGLWMLCDSKGKFEYRPKLMKLDILPFIPFDLQQTLDVLQKAGFFFTYEVKGKKYGMIPTFLDHQKINGKEFTSGEKYPDPEPVKKENLQGSDREVPENLQGAQEEEREEERELGKGMDKVPDNEDFILSRSILKDFGFNEINNFDKLRLIAAFIQKQKKIGRLEYFNEQYVNYHLFKNKYNERKHGFSSFFGSQESGFEDGKWDESNWKLKILELNNNGKNERNGTVVSFVATTGKTIGKL